MNQTATNARSGELPALRAGLACLGTAAVVPVGLFFVTGYLPLLLTGLIPALPFLICLLLMPAKPQKPRNAKDGTEIPPKAPGKLRLFLRKKAAGILTVTILALGFGLHLVFWKASAPETVKNLGFHIPVILATLFVLCIVFEKWCKYAAREASRYQGSLLRSLRSALAMAQAVLALTAVVLTVRILGFYDAQIIARVLLAVLFVYESVFLAFGLAVRLIRQELRTVPELLIPMPGISLGDMNILEYLEHNTGITMRSLWSMQFVKRELPLAAVCIAVVLWLSTGVAVIQSHQQGAVYRFGKLTEAPMEPGIHLNLPWPFGRVELYDTQSVSKVSIGYVPNETEDNFWTEAHGMEEYLLLLGGGDEVVSINLEVAYRISDLYAYLRASAAPESLLQAAAYEIVTARTIATDLDTLLAADRAAFSESFRQELAQRVDAYGIGMEVVAVVVESIHPPVEVARIYQQIISAGIDAERMIREAQNDAYTLISNAKNQYAAEVGNAKVQKYQQLADAESAVAGFMASVSADQAYRDEYRYYKYLNALTGAYSKATLILVGEGVDSSQIYLGNIDPVKEEEVLEDEYDLDVGDEYNYQFDEEGNATGGY